MKKGDKVTYIGENKRIGIIKSMKTDTRVYVVYSCNHNWDNYENYTGELTDVDDLQEGWIEDTKYDDI